MSSDERTESIPPTCEKARETIQESLDGPVPADRMESARGHVRDCESCREFEEGMRALRNALGSLPEIPFPDDALEEVWDKTVRSAPADPRTIGWWAGWRAAVAAVILVALGAALMIGTPWRSVEPEEPTAAELAKAEEEIRLVLALTSRTMTRTERTAVDRVLAGEVSPALNRIPIPWPENGKTEGRRSSS